MPKPIPTFEETFGVGKVPISAYFNIPKGASSDTSYGPDARAAFRQAEDFDRDQTARDAEMAAEDLLGEAGQMSDEEINQQLTQNPRLFGTQAARPLMQFQQFRQSQSPQTDVTLGPLMLNKIEDPRHRELFQSRMLEGMSANDAFEQYRRDEYNDQYANDLAEAGVTDAEMESLKGNTGLFDPTRVARMKAQKAAQTAASRLGKSKATPLDEEIELSKNHFEFINKALENATPAEQKDLMLARSKALATYQNAIAEKAKILRPPVIPKLASVVEEPEIAPATPAAAKTDFLPSPEAQAEQKEREVYTQEEKAKQQAASDEISRAWTDQKSKLTDEILKSYKPEELRSVADAILSNELILRPEKSALKGKKFDIKSSTNFEPYLNALSRRIGKDPSDVVFEEPLNERWGTQKVRYGELLREWAKEVRAVGKRLDQQAGASTQSKTSSMTGEGNGENLQSMERID